MCGVIPPLPQYAFMVWCSLKKSNVFSSITERKTNECQWSVPMCCRQNFPHYLEPEIILLCISLNTGMYPKVPGLSQ
jgi:hypothetical protein